MLPSNRLLSTNCFIDPNLISMPMTITRKSNHMLISLSQSLESDSKFMKTANRWDMSNYICKTIVSFKFFQLIFKPSNLIPWIFPIFYKPPILIIACLHIKTNDLSLWIEFEWFTVKAVLSELVDLLIRELIRELNSNLESQCLPLHSL